MADGWFHEDPAIAGWRYRILYDEEYFQPWGDALAPALLVERGRYARFADDVYQPKHANEIFAAWRHFGDLAMFERYLRIMHATTAVERVDSHDMTVITFDTNDFRAHAGITGVTDLSGEAAEWRAWLDGEVFGVQIEQRTGSGPGDWAVRDEIWGLYSWDYAISEATRMLASTASQAPES